MHSVRPETDLMFGKNCLGNEGSCFLMYSTVIEYIFGVDFWISWLLKIFISRSYYSLKLSKKLYEQEI